MNLLMAGFERERCRQRLTQLIQKKRYFLSERMGGGMAPEQFMRAVSIERQTSNPGSAGRRSRIASPGRVRAPLAAGRRGVSWTELDSDEISEDYLRKVPGRRMAWARSLGLWGNSDGITSRGEAFIKGLTRKGYIGADGIFVFWPMKYELVRNRFRSDLLGETREFWEAVLDVAWAYEALDVLGPTGEDSNHGMAVLADMMKVYRGLNSRKALLRQEMPVTIAFPAICALAIWAMRARTQPAPLP